MRHQLNKKNITILGIETSCDETAICILKARPNGDFKILSNIVSSQIKIHAQFGGVVPSLAKREHQKNLVPVLKLALKEARLLKIPNFQFLISNGKLRIIKEILNRDEILLKKIVPFLQKYKKPDIDLIAVTYGPGLAPALWPGVNLARTLSFYWNIPLKPINHLEAHILANWLKPVSEISNSKFLISKKVFPAVALIISGGHTQLILVKNLGKYKLIGETRDDAVGECFDKTARLLGLPYPGGPAIATAAAQVTNCKSQITNKQTKYQPRRPKGSGLRPQASENSSIKLPRPMINSNDFDFSFSGLKTAVLYLVQNLKKDKISIKKITPELCSEFQKTINDVLISKTLRAAKKFKAKSIILGGGVAANQSLNDEFKIKNGMPKVIFISPERKYTTDNAAMIAITALMNKKQKNIAWQKLQVDANLRLKEIK